MFKIGAYMIEKVKIGIIICDRYRTCAGGKCLKSLRNREGAFSVYRGKEVELAGFTTCGGCPGGNIEYAPEEMRRNGVEIIHLATGFIVGYPPCPYLKHFREFIPAKYGIEVVIGTHPVPQKYFIIHRELNTWSDPEWEEILQPSIADEKIRLAYD